MKFKGDIIITDPCYVIKNREENPHVYPNSDDPNYRVALDAYRRWDREHDDWIRCDCGSNMEILGFTTFISEPTIYGDWSCTTWDLGNKNPKDFVEEECERYRENERIKGLYGKLSAQYRKILDEPKIELPSIGTFCANSGQVGVFLLNEVLKYNPEFDYHLNRPWTTTLIENFDGEIEYYVDSEECAHILGTGNINFYTGQTGF